MVSEKIYQSFQYTLRSIQNLLHIDNYPLIEFTLSEKILLRDVIQSGYQQRDNGDKSMLPEIDAIHTFFNIYGISSQTLQEEVNNEEFRIKSTMRHHTLKLWKFTNFQ